MIDCMRTSYKDMNGLMNLCMQFLLEKQNLIGIEIGSFAGESANIFIKTNAFQKLYCIDPWLINYDPVETTAKVIPEAQKSFDQKFKNEKRIIKIKNFSNNVVNQFENESIDFIYIDGSHRYEHVKQDLNNYFPKIKKGGIIAGHDYEISGITPHIRGVKKAIDQFFQKPPLKNYVDNSWVYIK